MAYAASGLLRPADSRGVERQDVHRIRRQPHCRTGRRRHVDQGRQRDRVRRLQLRLEIAMIRRVLAARALRAFADGFIAVLLPADLLALGLGQLEVGVISTATLFGAIGALAAAVPEWLAARGALSMPEALRAMFVLYGAVGVAVWALYLRLPDARVEETKPAAPLGPSRSIVWRLAGLFSVDSFAGGLVVNSLLALWLFERFGMSLTAAGAFFFWTGLLRAASQLSAPRIARRIGLVNPMVFTHIPAKLCLIRAPLPPTPQLPP